MIGTTDLSLTFDNIAVVSNYMRRCREHIDRQKHQKEDLLRCISDLRFVYLRSQAECLALAFENQCWGMFCFATGALHFSKSHFKKLHHEEELRRRAVNETERLNAETARLQAQLREVDAQRQSAVEAAKQSNAQVTSLQAEIAKLKGMLEHREKSGSETNNLYREQLQLRDETIGVLQKQNEELLERVMQLQPKLEHASTPTPVKEPAALSTSSPPIQNGAKANFLTPFHDERTRKIRNVVEDEFLSTLLKRELASRSGT